MLCIAVSAVVSIAFDSNVMVLVKLLHISAVGVIHQVHCTTAAVKLLMQPSNDSGTMNGF